MRQRVAQILLRFLRAHLRAHECAGCARVTMAWQLTPWKCGECSGISYRLGDRLEVL